MKSNILPCNLLPPPLNNLSHIFLHLNIDWYIFLKQAASDSISMDIPYLPISNSEQSGYFQFLCPYKPMNMLVNKSLYIDAFITVG